MQQSLVRRVSLRFRLSLVSSIIFHAFTGQCYAQDSHVSDSQLTEIVIHSSPFTSPLNDLNASATAFDSHEIEKRSVTSLQQLVGSVPGLQWSAGSALPRFFQIRGIGELEQYQGAPNPSVGMIIDDIDYSGISVIVPLFDIQQVEVLKGPQGIRYGSSALAGVINLQSTNPSSLTSGKAELRGGNDALRAGSIAVGGAIPGTSDRLQLRIASSHSHQDGFRDNHFLNRSDTNERDLHTTRVKLRVLPSDDLEINLTSLMVDNNSGFDAFSIDNSLVTQSDRPGADQVESRAGALNIAYRIDPQVTIRSITSYSRTNIDYSFDGDWGNNPFWQPYAPYDYFSAADRSRNTLSQEVRITDETSQIQHDRDWRHTAGLFLQRLNEQTQIADSADDLIYNQISSDYGAKTGAIFASSSMPLGDGRSFELGGRLEHRQMDYRDDRPSNFSPTNAMWAGSASLRQDLSENIHSYLQVSRGFKGGGFNPGTRVPTLRRIYQPEHQWNFEIGAKGNLSETVRFDSALFHSLRRDAQLKFAFQDNPSDPLSFTYLTESSARGESTGFESSVSCQVSQKLSLFLNGLAMDSKYTAAPAEVSSLLGRSYSHAPNWQFSSGAHYQLTELLFLQTDISRQGKFYFDDSHNQTSTPYSILNVSAGVRDSTWSWTIWAKNVFSENYPVRGFYFGNEPPDFTAKKYVQRGDPLFFGTTLSYSF